MQNLAQFLKVNGYFATEAELNSIIRRLDVDGDRVITFAEFIESMKS